MYDKFRESNCYHTAGGAGMMFFYVFYDVPKRYRWDAKYLLSATHLWGGGQQRGDMSSPDLEQ
jgi:hypothetical protein